MGPAWKSAARSRAASLFERRAASAFFRVNRPACLGPRRPGRDPGPMQPETDAVCGRRPLRGATKPAAAWPGRTGQLCCRAPAGQGVPPGIRPLTAFLGSSLVLAAETQDVPPGPQHHLSAESGRCRAAAAQTCGGATCGHLAPTKHAQIWLYPGDCVFHMLE